MYILWAYVPSPMLHQMGIHYYPNRWWALAVPAWLVMLVIWIYVALASYNTGYLTLPMTSVENLVDRCGTVAVVDMMEKKAQAEKDNKTNNIKNTNHDNHQRQASDEKDWKSLWSTGTDAVLDVPIGGVCEILYGSGREDSDIDT
jgi:phosphatidylinositol glycan class P protein